MERGTTMRFFLVLAVSMLPMATGNTKQGFFVPMVDKVSPDVYGGVQTYTFALCQALCQRDVLCLGFNWDKTNLQCQFSSTKTVNDDTNFVFYEKETT